jgi:hypothetical protein
MKKLNKKSCILIASTMILVGFSTLLLTKAISMSGEMGVGKLESIALDKKFGQADDGISLHSELYIKKVPVDKKEQEEVYQSIKDEINIQKEDAKNIARKNIYSIFGDSLEISDEDISFYMYYVLEQKEPHYNWSIVAKTVNKKQYSCQLNATTGECWVLSRTDFKGLKDPDESGFVQIIYNRVLPEDKLQLYTKQAREIINEFNKLNSKENNIERIYLEYLGDMGLRPTAFIGAIMQDHTTMGVNFYTDTDELAQVY